MGASGKSVLNMNINPDLLARIEEYRHRRMFATRSEAIEFLLRAALKLNPDRDKEALPKGTRQ
jgi:metal-responsive CopG/Arc/MetJ family transcriptional regulator